MLQRRLKSIRTAADQTILVEENRQHWFELEGGMPGCEYVSVLNLVKTQRHWIPVLRPG